MAEKTKKEVAEVATEKPKVDESVEKLKIKKPKMKKFQEPSDGVVKVDLKELAKKAEDIVKVDTTNPVEEIKTPEQTQDVETSETPVLEEVKEQTEEPTPVKQEVDTPPKYPEGVEKLLNFMNDTGGDINDYVKLNKDYSEMDNHTLLKEKN